jgi:6-pyruvoyltetrahydropterin/6-carboxytetrahydropterin synthase
MYRIGVRTEFSAAHFLAGYRGSCEAIHGHNYRVEAVVRVEQVDEIGLGLDFRELKRHLGEVTGELDHKLLNEVPAFRERNPSSENIARHIFERLSLRLGPGPARLAEVKVWETDDAWAAYRDAVDEPAG